MKIIKTLLIFILAVFCGIASLFSLEKIEKVSGDRQIGIAGKPLKKDFVVKVLSAQDVPVSGVPVVFSLINENKEFSKEKNTFFSSPVSITDEDGIAATRLNIGTKSRGELIVSAATRESLASPAVFTVSAQGSMWIFIMCLGIFGGLGIFLFGMFFLNESLQKISGQKLKKMLRKFTDSPWKGMGTGFFVTLLNQSSTATTVLEVSLVSAGIMTFYQSMFVTIGAEIGSTFTAQLVAFKIANYAVFIAGSGFFISFLSKTKKLKNYGDALLGFGILFLGMKIMIDILNPVSQYWHIIDTMKAIENPFIGIAAGLIFTLIVQSSGATAGIVIAMAMSGAITLNQAIPINLGAQIGTCITAFISSIGRNRESKRVALWHVLHQTAGVIMIYPFITIVAYGGEPAWIYFIKDFTRRFLFTSDTARQIAMAHTLLSVFNALIFLPFIPLFSRLLVRILPSTEKERPFGPIYIDNGLLENPSLALEQSKKEIVREGMIVLEMFREALQVFDDRDSGLSDTVSFKDFKVDILRNKIISYLTKIAQNPLNEEQSLRETQLLYITADFEAMGDIIDKNIMPLARKKIRHELWFSDEGWKDIVELHFRVENNLKAIIDALDKNDFETAKNVRDSKGPVNSYEAELRKRHIQRINTGLKESLDTSSVHLDLIGQFKRVNSYITDIAYTILINSDDGKKKPES